MDEARGLYDTLNNNAQKLGVDLTEVNTKLFGAVAAAVNEPITEIRTLVESSLQTSREVKTDVSSLPQNVTKDINDIPATLQFDQLHEIPKHIKGLLSSFQTASEDHTSLFPKLPFCGNMAVDPKKVMNFQKQFSALEKLQGVAAPASADGTSPPSGGDRAITTKPKTSGEVIQNVTASIQKLSDPITEAMTRVDSIKLKFEEAKGSVEQLHQVKQPLDDLCAKQSELQGVANKVMSLFGNNQGEGEEASRGIPDGSNVMDIISEGQSAATSIQNFRGPIEASATQIKDSTNIFTSLATELKSLFELAKSYFDEMVALLKQFISSLPLIIEELKKFFIPTGVRAIFLKPSKDLMALIKTADDVKAAIPNPDSVQASARGVLEGETGPVGKIDGVKNKLQTLSDTPEQLVAVIGKQDIGDTVTEAAKDNLKQQLQDMGGDLMGSAIDNVAAAIGGDALGETMTSFFGMGGDEKKAEEEQNPSQQEEPTYAAAPQQQPQAQRWGGKLFGMFGR